MKKPNKSLVFLRAGFIGDILTCLPYVFYEINKHQLSFVDVYFVQFQKSNINEELKNKKTINTIKLIFGKDFNNSYMVEDYSIKTLSGVVNEIYKKNNKKQILFKYLPFTLEPKTSLIKKYIYFIFAGIKLSDLQFMTLNKNSRSEYLSLFKNPIDFEIGTVKLREFISLNNKHNVLKLNIFENAILIFPNSQLKIKLWPKASYIKLIKSILKKHTNKILLIGGSDDFSYNQNIIEEVNSAKVLNIAGNYSISDSIVYFRHAKLYIGNDGGPMHISALSNIPIIGLFSFKDEAGIWDPIISDNYVSIRTDVSCKVCKQFTCDNNICLKYISVENVLNFVDSFLRAENHKIQIINSSASSIFSKNTG
jgi:hypothetical protein